MIYIQKQYNKERLIQMYYNLQYTMLYINTSILCMCI